MLTLVRIPRSRRSAAAAAALIADYTTFDRRRADRRHYIRAFGGLALIVLLGAAFRFVPGREALVAAAVFGTPPATLAVVDALQWRKLAHRLRTIQAEVQQIRT